MVKVETEKQYRVSMVCNRIGISLAVLTAAGFLLFAFIEEKSLDFKSEGWIIIAAFTGMAYAIPRLIGWVINGCIAYREAPEPYPPDKKNN
jgi:hypothetical protein